MKTIRLLLACAALSTLNLQLSTAFAQGTAFTYQGVLSQSGAAVNGSNDLTFTLYNASSGGATVGTSNVFNDLVISNGLFTVTLNFGASAFDGTARWLEIAARPGASTGGYTNLAPRTPITPTPYAIYAGSANATNLVGTVQSANLSGVALLAGGNALTGNQTVTSGSVGIGTTSPAKTLDVTGSASGVASGGSIDPSVFVRLNNSATDGNLSSSDLAGIGFGHNSTRQAIVGGTFGNDFLDFYTGGLLTSPKMRIDNNGGVTLNDPRVGAFGSGAIINLSDSFSGSVESSAIDSVGNGGGFTWRNGALELRPVSRLNIYRGSDVTSAGTVALTMIGSSGNVGIGTTTPANTLDVQGSADFSGNVGIGTTTPQHKLDVNGNIFLGTQRNGQIFNEIGDTLYLGAEQKYLGNTLASPVDGSTDWINLMANPLSAGIMFGLSGLSTTNPHSNTVPLMVIESNGNVGIGTTSPARKLTVNTPNYGIEHTDGNVRLSTYLEASGGWIGTVSPHDFHIFVNDGTASMTIFTNSNTSFAGEVTCTAINITSDRNAKEQFKPINGREVLDKVARLPISEWQYKAQGDARHIGPMAQDFREAFTLGHDEKHISMVDESGVALAAIQGLNEKLEEKTQEVEALKKSVAALTELVRKLAARENGAAQ